MGVPISNVPRRVVYAASGTGPYNFSFEILAATDIAVYRDDTLLTLTTNYTVTINPNGTGYVTLTAAPTGATQIAIVGNRTIQRTSDFVTGGDFFANTVNNELDQLTIFAQQNAEGLQRALVAPQTDPTTIDMTLPRAADRANKTLAFDANGDPTLGISAADVANAVTYAANAANSATAAAASASSASSSASSASTSATNAANSATSASNSASSASSSASSASTSASSASTSATNAANSASSASTSASNASTSATNAANSATSASNSASTATTQATNASNSATAAATSASDAATSAAAAAAALDNFDDRYLGAKSSDPTVDNDGNALVTGALYYRTTTPVGMKVYDGAQWLAASSAMQAAMVTYEFVATAGQTTFSDTDANGATLSYVSANIVVTLNGSALRPGDDYTATNGSSIVLASAASLNDELIVLAFNSFNVANTYTQSQVNGFLAAKANQSTTYTKTETDTLLAGKQASDAELTTLAGMSSDRATFLASNNGFAFRNRIINGDMRIDQRNVGASITPAGTTYCLDRWQLGVTQASKLSVQRVSDAPTGFINSLRVTVASQFSPGAGDAFYVQQPIEGFNIADLAFGTSGAVTITTSFQVKASVTGTYSCRICNGSANRNYIATYTISSANTWTPLVLTIAGDTSGTWATDNTAGMFLSFDLGSGSSLNGTAGAWSSSNQLRTSGSVTFVNQTAGATWQITGVQLERGTVATPFQFEDYSDTLRKCQRYLPAVTFDTGTAGYSPVGTGFAYGTGSALITVPFQVKARTGPSGVTVSNVGSFSLYNSTGSLLAATAISANASSDAACNIVVSVASGLTAGNGTSLAISNINARLLFTGCEL